MKTTPAGNTVALTLTALFIALTAICSWISIPVPGTSVPINLATFSVILAGVILGSRRGALAMAIFLVLGAIGLPVFHSFTGGLGIVAGPTGGFLIGYIALAFLAGLHRDLGVPFLAAAILGEIVLYALGCIWFIHLTGSTLPAALAACVLPFLPGDAAKILLVMLIKDRIRKALPSLGR